MYFTVHAGFLQVHTDMFGIRIAGFPEARAVQGNVPDRPETYEVSSLGREWIRPCAVIFNHGTGSETTYLNPLHPLLGGGMRLPVAGLGPY